MLHISDIKKFDRCRKYAWLHKKEPLTFFPFVYYNENIIDLIKEKFGISECYEGKTGDDNSCFSDHKDQFSYFFNVRFEKNDLRIKVPFMIKKEHGFDIYFVYQSVFPKEHVAQSIADHLWVLQDFISVTGVHILHLNSEYVRKESLCADELLVISDYLYNDKNKPGKSLESLIAMHTRDLNPILSQLKECLEDEEMESVRTNVCTRGNKCPYFDRCFTHDDSDTSILHLVQASKKYDMLEEGITDIKDIDDYDKIEGTRHQYAQILAAKTNELYFDYPAMKKWVDTKITYPISYLDFEWETYAYPPYAEMKPFDVLVFQYSLHIEEKGKELVHKQFLEKGDCRIAFIEQLIHDIPKEGSVMVFNMEGAEKLRLKQLAKQFPRYHDELEQIWERMVDLSIPFSTGNIYDNRMRGMFSLKILVDVFADVHYSDLDISYGMDAVRNWRMLDETSEESKEIKNHLFEYCAMDTYSEYLIYHWILDQIDKRKKK